MFVFTINIVATLVTIMVVATILVFMPRSMRRVATTTLRSWWTRLRKVYRDFREDLRAPEEAPSSKKEE